MPPVFVSYIRRSGSGILLFLFCFSARAQNSFSLSPSSTRALVDSLATQLVTHYVSKDTALKMSACLKKRYKEGRYNNIRDPHTLAALLTEDVRSVYRDEHFHVDYNPALIDELNNNIDDVPKMVEEKLKRERAKNFGFRKTEILPGNIGYLEISSFSRLNQYSRAAAHAALQMVGNTRALIIDLRYGNGGSPEMINYLMGFFLREKTHTADVFIRHERTHIAWWSEPDTTPGNLMEIPIYVLTSYKTFSAAEGLSYELQAFKRGTIVGETTRGGAHTVSYRALSSGFVVDLPFGRVTCPVTGGNWEKTGVKPDVAVAAEDALEKAELLILEKALSSASNQEKTTLQWQADLLLSVHHPFPADTELLRARAGDYGAFKIEYTSGALFYQKTGMARFALVPLSEDMMKVKGNDSFRVRFQRDSSTGKVSQITTCYEDGRMEVAQRKD